MRVVAMDDVADLSLQHSSLGQTILLACLTLYYINDIHFLFIKTAFSNIFK